MPLTLPTQLQPRGSRLNSTHTPARLVGLSEAHSGAELLKTQSNMLQRRQLQLLAAPFKVTRAGLPFTSGTCSAPPHRLTSWMAVMCFFHHRYF